jgi:hypothetical protein
MINDPLLDQLAAPGAWSAPRPHAQRGPTAGVGDRELAESAARPARDPGQSVSLPRAYVIFRPENCLLSLQVGDCHYNHGQLCGVRGKAYPGVLPEGRDNTDTAQEPAPGRLSGGKSR